MSANLTGIFAIVGIAALIIALVSLFAPKTAFFLRKKTRLRAMFAWFGIAAACLIIGAAAAPESKKVHFQPTPATQTQKKQDKIDVKPETTAQENAEQAKLVPYLEAEVKDTSLPRRRRGQVFITLAEPDGQFTSDQLAATCMAAAKHYAKEYGFKALTVFFSDLPGGQSWEGTRLAQCSYSPDKGGWSGNQNWLWQGIQVVERGLTDQERQMKKLWGEMRSKYQKNGSTDEAALSKAIAKKLGVKPDEVHLPYLFPKDVAPQNFAGIDSYGPSNRK